MQSPVRRWTSPISLSRNVDANAIAPATARSIAERFDQFVDGGIIGPPAHEHSSTRLYLAGAEATQVAALWNGSVLDARTIGGDAGAASALKLAYSTWTKASSAMVLAVRAFAAVGMPSGFGDAAGDIGGRLSEFKNRTGDTLADVVDRLRS